MIPEGQAPQLDYSWHWRSCSLLSYNYIFPCRRHNNLFQFVISSKRTIEDEEGSSAKRVASDSLSVAMAQGQAHQSQTDLINSLNDDCLAKVFSYLSLQDRFTIQAVCRRWRENPQLAWSDVKSLDLSDMDLLIKVSKATHDDVVTMFKGFGPCLQDLEIHPICHFVMPFPKILPLIGEYCGELRKLEIEFFHNPKTCPKWVPRRKNIKRVIKKKRCQHFSDNFFKTLPHETLTELHFSVHSGPKEFLSSSIPRAAISAFDQLTNLSALTFAGYRLTPSIVMAINQKPNLRFLSLENCKARQGLPRLDLLINLEHLNMSKVSEVNDDFIIQVSETCKSLKHLNLGKCENVTNRGISALVELSELSEFILSYIPRITDEPLGRMQNLRKLECEGCTFVMNIGLCALFRSANNLEYLNVSGCNVDLTLLGRANYMVDERPSGVELEILVDGTLETMWSMGFGYRSPLLNIEGKSIEDDEWFILDDDC